ncbi:DUF3772 domain-containing protein [Sphingomonas morindae]|uniref:DUF3772 domain-containing protein n=1 Tax=Sphingomonas morindae TaxID=1541170 RepID=A0ABY4XDD7_9SPHN|nr:DUF3772 domain-containing protein [Sphingomonas morindae]USI74995.1 DUF3772 domain-containing protein [Sphingomonas morindae]
MILRLALLLLLSVLPALPLRAQDVAAANGAIESLAQAARDYKAIDTAFTARSDATERRGLEDRANGVRQAADDAVALLGQQIALVDARIAQLGPVTPGVSEAPDIRAQRRQLAISRSTLDSAIKRGKLLSVEAQQLAAEIDDSAVNAFNERITARTPSPLTGRFWSLFAEGLPRDARRIRGFVGEETDAIAQGLARPTRWPALLGLLAALLLLGPARRMLARAGMRLMIERAPASRLRRSGLALWTALVGTLLPGFAALALVNGLDAAGMIAPSWDRLGGFLVRVSFVAAAIVALGAALLQPKAPSWRLPLISDAAAAGLRRWTRVAAGVVLATALLGSFTAEAGSGSPLTIATDGLTVALDMALVFGVLRSIAGYRRRAEAAREAEGESGGVIAGGTVALAAWVAVAFTIVALLAGYFTLALTVARMLLWWPVVASALYLLLIAADDLCTGLIARDSRLGLSLHQSFGVRGSLVDQAGVFLSALVRLILVALAFSLAMGPFGSNITSLFDIIDRVSQGLTIGQVTIAPGAILRALAVLAAGLFVVRTAQRWLTDRYLPATELDAGARNSIAMVARYSGLILATLWALASLGIGIERIALLLSALSVGIGFGLQAITQNFVSGLILLAERPVKIGDWVRIGSDEGDIKRISVRATEIQIADRSTLIVPNSELITKAVLNKTLSDPLGRIQLQFSIPLGADVGAARDRLLAIYAETPAVLEEPAPAVFIDSIVDGRVLLNSFAHVRSPREVYSTRSAILFRLLTELPAAGIELGVTPQQMQIISDARAAPAAAPDPAAPQPAG